MKIEENSSGQTKRKYNAPIRREQLELTRRRILDTARYLFTERGYTATTVEAIAKHAKVAVPTLYTTFGSKQQILTALVWELKESQGVPDQARAIIAEPDPHRQISAAAALTRFVVVSAWDVMELLRTASKSDRELAVIWDEVEGYRLSDQLEIIKQWAESGRLRSGLSVAEAGDVFWSLTSHEFYHLLVVQRGWTADRYEQWLVASLAELLLR